MMWLSIITFLTIVGLASVVSAIIRIGYYVVAYFTVPVHLDALDRIQAVNDALALSHRNT